MDLNLIAKKDSFEHQPPPLEEDSSQPQPPYDHVTHKQSHMSMLDLLAIEDGEISLLAKERGIREKWKLQFPWIHLIMVNSFSHLKCIYCERFHVKGPLRNARIYEIYNKEH